MTIKRGTVGDGLTEKPTISWDEDADEAHPEIAELIERSGLNGLLSAIEAECFAIMEREGLPTYHGCFMYDRSGQWRAPTPPFIGSGCRIANEIWPIARARGHSRDSSVGFASRMLGDIVWLRRANEAGDHDRATELAFYLGVHRTELRIKTDHEATWKSGKASRDGGRMGAEAKRMQLDARNRAIIESYLKRRQKQDPPTARRHTAAEFGLSAKQVGRIIPPD